MCRTARFRESTGRSPACALVLVDSRNQHPSPIPSRATAIGQPQIDARGQGCQPTHNPHPRRWGGTRFRESTGRSPACALVLVDSRNQHPLPIPRRATAMGQPQIDTRGQGCQPGQPTHPAAKSSWPLAAPPMHRANTTSPKAKTAQPMRLRMRARRCCSRMGTQR